MAGRPKSSFSIEQIQKIEQYALDGCQTGTIATLMDIPYNTLNRHFGKNMHKKRCERKQILRDNQNRLAKTYPAMAIFLGKNELKQVDKQEIKQTSEREADKLARLTEEERKFREAWEIERCKEDVKTVCIGRQERA